jgi:hypothetical protein
MLELDAVTERVTALIRINAVGVTFGYLKVNSDQMPAIQYSHPNASSHDPADPGSRVLPRKSLPAGVQRFAQDHQRRCSDDHLKPKR